MAVTLSPVNRLVLRLPTECGLDSIAHSENVCVNFICVLTFYTKQQNASSQTESKEEKVQIFAQELLNNPSPLPLYRNDVKHCD